MHSKLEVLFRKMQADMVAYLEPGNDCGQDWFVNRMIWHMDGPEQREAQGEAAGASPVQPSQAVERKYISPVRTVADLANNLLMMDQALPIYGAQYIEHAGTRRCIAVSPTLSRERIKDGRWIGEGDELNAAVIWTRAAQARELSADDVRAAGGIVHSDGNIFFTNIGKLNAAINAKGAA